MADLYPQSLPCRFEGFPPRIQVVCGRAFSERPGTPYSFGSRVILAQTPRSGQTSCVLAVGEPIPTTEIIYADTGDDDEYNLKISHYGLGRFYLADADDAWFRLVVVKGIRLEAAGLSRAFETVDIWETLIPATAAVPAPSVTPDAVWLEDATDATETDRVRATWFTGDIPAGGRIVRGRLQLAGDVAVGF
ncbi:hypothetical protein [Solidesulfovibrio magneticus]|uniref:Uncharacterized protein n=1 Tax=Solidesulfovibrio magneticus (strain ATCC 700980 / DSM 13731 / RS-1) TaxID=573370 RepID=C4XHE2_SOLM1|nr:hypothetical protein [Solidesulfovibrio magneticus]BAH73910.1 hypothetical protein DMR_04190 [Solidesulfovibrio magneticus RS-1]